MDLTDVYLHPFRARVCVGDYLTTDVFKCRFGRAEGPLFHCFSPFVRVFCRQQQGRGGGHDAGVVRAG